MKKFLYAICTLLLSCNSNTKSNFIEYSVTPEAKGVINLSELVDSVSYIKLEATPQSSLKYIQSVYMDDDYMIIPDSKSVFFFHKNGSYSHKISKNGRGRGEYISLTSMTIDTENNRIMIYDLQSKRLLSYAYDGRFLKQISDFSDNRWIREIHYIPSTNGFLCSEFSHGNSNELLPELWEVDSLGMPINDLVMSEFKHPVHTPTFTLADMDNGEVCYMHIESDYDYLYEKGDVEPLVAYNVQGKVASSYKGLTNMEFARDYWSQNKSINARKSTIHRGDFILSLWSSENMGDTFYTLINKGDNSIAIGDKINGKLENMQEVLPSNIIDEKEIYIISKSNIPGVIAIPFVASSIKNEKILDLLDVPQSEVDYMNPVLQLLYVKE